MPVESWSPISGGRWSSNYWMTTAANDARPPWPMFLFVDVT